MFELRGRFASAKVFARTVDANAVGQVTAMLNMPYMEGSRVRIMPDAHAGAGCVVGTTMDVKSRPVCPNLVGCDIGCGMLSVKLAGGPDDLEAFDGAIRASVPAGQKGNPRQAGGDEARELASGIRSITDRAKAKGLSTLGTLGGGNHFIELDRSEKTGAYWLVIHSGSRSFGLPVLNAYMKRAIHGKDAETGAWVPPELAYLDGDGLAEYLHDMKTVQALAAMNRRLMADAILAATGLEEDPDGTFETVHNYLDTDAMVLRKGAVSARAGERVLIPMNMRDGSLLCEGLGNADWNCSAPHGAGRLMSRADAKRSLSLDEYRASMAGVYSSSVGESTIDESPMAYKDPAEIAELIAPTAKVLDRLLPVYNFKAGGR